jgi:uncharacterized membrane protein YgdD (TMEM256/DUF423 family)
MGALLAAAAVAFGAFGAHALKAKLAPEALAVFRTATEYHFYHALGLLLIGAVAMRVTESAILVAAGWLMFAGTLLFSGSLYLLAITGIRWLGVLTPLGGLAFIAAWLLFAWAVLRS